MNGYQKSNPITEVSSLPIIIQSNNLLIENERQSSINNQSDDVDIDEIELSSDDDDDNDRTAIAERSMIDELATSSNLVNDEDESTYDEQMETNESSSIPPLPLDVSNSNDRDLYDNVSSSSISNQSTFDTRLSAEEQATIRYIYYFLLVNNEKRTSFLVPMVNQCHQIFDLMRV
jgi:hypothetical protein